MVLAQYAAARIGSDLMIRTEEADTFATLAVPETVFNLCKE
jgi:hypothetical protein